MSGNTLIPIAFIRDPDQARSLLDPLRRSILQLLQEPGSSSTVAQSLDLPRQRLNYHVRALENEGLLVHLEDRRKGNCVERVVRARARQYVIDPAILGALGFEGSGASDHRFSFSMVDLVGASCRTLSQVGDLLEPDPGAESPLPTLTLEAHIRFRSPQEEAEFAKSLREVLDRMTRRYHDLNFPAGRTFRITVGGHLDPQSCRPSHPNRAIPSQEKSP